MLFSRMPFVGAFCVRLTAICFGASIGALILRARFDTPPPLSKNRVPLILAHVFEVLLKTIYLRNIDLTFRARRISP
jgi:hypothetical protein